MAINLLSRAEPRRLNYLYMFCISLLKKKKQEKIRKINRIYEVKKYPFF